MGKRCRLRKVYTTSIWVQATTVIERQKKLFRTCIVITEITEPLNNNSINYYSILNVGSSSAKMTDEKEFLIKTAAKGTPKFEVMSLEEPKSCDAEGLKESLAVATGRMNFSFSRSQKELGMCSDGASVNVKCHRLVQEELGSRYSLILCASIIQPTSTVQ